LFDDADVERLCWISRVRETLGLPLEELASLFGEERLREVARGGSWSPEIPLSERVQLVDNALATLDRQLLEVARRAAQLAELEAELVVRRRALEATRIVD
jgi:DNA-binding transcriptional MerR regulator